MSKTLFRRIFRKPGPAPLERLDGAPTRTADQQSELSEQPSHAAAAATPISEAEAPAERDLTSYVSAALASRDAGRFEEAEKLLVEAVERFPTEPRPQIELAIVSHARRDWPEAVQRWEIVRGEFPNEPLSYTFAAAALRAAGRSDEAEALAESARERFPGNFLALLEYARAAEHRDPARALDGWQELRDRFPDRIEGYAGLAAAFRRLGRVEEADAILAETVEKFPDSPQMALEFARIAEARRDWPRALERWSAVRDAFPDEVWGYVGCAVALRELRRNEEAEPILAEAVERFPAEPRLHIDWALLAHHRGNWREAASRWADVRTRFPDQAIAIGHGAAALSRLQQHEAAEALLAEGRERFPNDLGIGMESAWLPTHRRDWAEALRRWQSVRDTFPDNPRGYTGTAMVQRELGWLSEAETTLAEAIERFPRDLAARIDYARLAEIRRARTDALRRWDGVRAAFPDQAAGYTGAAALLREARRFEEAEALLSEAAMRFPDDARLDIERAMLAHHRRDWAEAAPRWEKVRARLPDDRAGYLHGAAVLREQKRFDEAAAVLSAALDRFPAEPGLQVEFALLAEARGEWAPAAESWAALRIAFPQDVRGFTFGARALRQLGHSEEAENLLTEAVHRFPNDAAVSVEHALFPQNARNWPEALRRWNKVRKAFPENPWGYSGSARALLELGEFAQAEQLLMESMHRFPEDTGAAFTWAECAMRREAWTEAVLRWDQLRARFPDQITCYTAGARVYRELRLPDEAEALLREAINRFPQALEPGVEFALLAQQEQKWEEAAERWEQVRRMHPELPAGYTGAAISLRQAFRLDEAEAVASEAVDRFPSEPGPLTEVAMIAHIRRDLPTAVARWEQLRESFPGEVVGYIMGALDLFNLHRDDEAEHLLREGIEQFPDSAEPAIGLARAAERRQRWSAAIQRWEHVRERFPGRVEGYTGGALALSSSSRVREAESLLETAADRFPQDPQVACEYAWIAYRGHRWDDAEQRFSMVRERFPAEPNGYRGGAAVLISRGQLEDAERLLEMGMVRIPSNPFLVLEHARIPSSPLLHDGRNWDLAISRLETLCTRFPDFEFGQIDLVRLLASRDRLEEAEAAASRALQRRTRTPDLGIEYARIALKKGDWAEALRRYGSVTERFPDSAAGFVGQAEALSRLGRYDEAEELLERAKTSFPADSAPYAEYARIAMRRGDPAEALRRWAETSRRFPEDNLLAQELFVARLQAADADPAAVIASERDSAMEGDATSKIGDELPPTRELVCAFESLGGTLLGCEFGLFQRAHGAEPLGLLRWTDMEPEGLIAALEVEFEGVGLPEYTELVTPPDIDSEYAARDRRFGMRMHTFISKREVPASKMYVQVCRRLRFLRDKLVADLKSGEKIFVYKITARNLTEDELRRLHAAVRRYGDNTLLYVQYTDSEHPAGTVEWAAPGLLLAYIERFAMSPSGENLGAQTVAWTEICQKVYSLWQSRRSPGTPSASSEEHDAGEFSGELAASELVMNFESLGGGGHGCEFGLFQREFGAEPLGLLRWADLDHESLADALETGFEGVGCPEQTELFVPPSSGRGEYWTRDKRYWMAMRTFVSADEIAEDKMFERVCRRLQFLKHKMIEDLAGANKIFVYKTIARNLTEEEVARIHRAMRSYGENTFLYVAYADADHPPGTIALAKPGLLLGYVERFAFSPDDTSLGPATEGWLAICRAAYGLWKSRIKIPDLKSAEEVEAVAI